MHGLKEQDACLRYQRGRNKKRGREYLSGLFTQLFTLWQSSCYLSIILIRKLISFSFQTHIATCVNVQLDLLIYNHQPVKRVYML